MKRILCIAGVLLAAGCATRPSGPSSEVADVRIITHEAATILKCRHLSRINSLKSAGEGGMPSAHADARSKVAKAGGNALAITTQSATPQGGGEIAGDGYACVSF